MKGKVKKIVAVLVLVVGLFSTNAMATYGVKHGCYKNKSWGYSAGFGWTKITVGTMYHHTKAWVGTHSSTKHGERYTQTDVVSGFGTVRSHYWLW